MLCIVWAIGADAAGPVRLPTRISGAAVDRFWITTMNSPSLRGLACPLLALLALAGLTPDAPAAEALVVPADLFTEIVHDRARLIQLSAVLVSFGIALLWWKK